MKTLCQQKMLLFYQLFYDSIHFEADKNLDLPGVLDIAVKKNQLNPCTALHLKQYNKQHTLYNSFFYFSSYFNDIFFLKLMSGIHATLIKIRP